MANVTLLDTSLASANIGDRVIVDSILRHIPELRDVPRAATHNMPTMTTWRNLRNADLAVFAGTNVLTPKLWRRRQWPSLTLLNQTLSGKVMYVGVGWGADVPAFDRTSRQLLLRTMPEGSTLGVRDMLTYDRATASRLPATYIGCPTMWQLPDVLPRWAGISEVVTTVTDYNRNPSDDSAMFAELARRFERFYFWPQGSRDLEYARSLPLPENCIVLDRSLLAYESAIRGRGHIGTRLHGGIRALQLGSPSLIFSVDHRATAIGRDTGLPVVTRRESVRDVLECHIVGDEPNLMTIPRREATCWLDDLRRRL